jgi:hypothetical protein
MPKTKIIDTRGRDQGRTGRMCANTDLPTMKAHGSAAETIG